METTAQDIMSTEILTASEGMSIEDALKLLVNNKITGLPVVNKEGKMIGVLSEYDILVQTTKFKKLSHKNLMNSIKFPDNVHSILEDTPVENIIEQFIETQFRRLPVINSKGKLIGIITRRDLMRLLYYRAKLS